MDKEALLYALDKRREDLTDVLRSIGSSENEALDEVGKVFLEMEHSMSD